MRLCFLFVAASLWGEDLPITGISHVNFLVSDLDAARAFYTGVLGFPEAFTMKRPDGSIGNVSLKVNDTQFIELSPRLQPDQNQRLTHISLVTSDIETLHRLLTERGLAPTPLRPPGADGTRGIRIMDSEGNALEFTQYLPGSKHSQARGKFLDANRIAPRMSHAGVVARDPDAALKFYRDKLGFIEVWPMAPGHEKEKQWNLRVPGPDGDYLELMGRPEIPTRAQWGGLQHLCLLVPDAEAAYRLVKERGAKASLPAIGKTRRWLFNAYDPDGSRIEFIEPKLATPRPAQPRSTGPAALDR